MKLTFDKTRVYRGGLAYRACVDGDCIALAKRKTDAEQQAIASLYSAYQTAGNPPAIAVLQDGRILVGTEVNSETFALWYFEHDGKRSRCSAIGNRAINGRPCTLEQYVRYNALMSDGADCWNAAESVFSNA